MFNFHQKQVQINFIALFPLESWFLISVIYNFIDLKQHLCKLYNNCQVMALFKINSIKVHTYTFQIFDKIRATAALIDTLRQYALLNGWLNFGNNFGKFRIICKGIQKRIIKNIYNL